MDPLAAEGVRYGGVLLALPALLSLGLLDTGEQTYGTLTKAFYGLRATLLLLAFMALLRIRTPEQLQGHPPGELGLLLGLDRAPEVKTLRRKLWELATRRQATRFSQALAERTRRSRPLGAPPGEDFNPALDPDRSIAHRFVQSIADGLAMDQGQSTWVADRAP